MRELLWEEDAEARAVAKHERRDLCDLSGRRQGLEIEIRVNGGVASARVRLKPFFDPEGERLRS